MQHTARTECISEDRELRINHRYGPDLLNKWSWLKKLFSFPSPSFFFLFAPFLHLYKRNFRLQQQSWLQQEPLPWMLCFMRTPYFFFFFVFFSRGIINSSCSSMWIYSSCSLLRPFGHLYCLSSPLEKTGTKISMGTSVSVAAMK